MSLPRLRTPFDFSSVGSLFDSAFPTLFRYSQDLDQCRPRLKLRKYSFHDSGGPIGQWGRFHAGHTRNSDPPPRAKLLVHAQITCTVVTFSPPSARDAGPLRRRTRTIASRTQTLLRYLFASWLTIVNTRSQRELVPRSSARRRRGAPQIQKEDPHRVWR